jgi:purine nucleoside permease
MCRCVTLREIGERELSSAMTACAHARSEPAIPSSRVMISSTLGAEKQPFMIGA